jgi:hypothetical protein
MSIRTACRQFSLSLNRQQGMELLLPEVWLVVEGADLRGCHESVPFSARYAAEHLAIVEELAPCAMPCRKLTGPTWPVFVPAS